MFSKTQCMYRHDLTNLKKGQKKKTVKTSLGDGGCSFKALLNDHVHKRNAALGLEKTPVQRPQISTPRSPEGCGFIIKQALWERSGDASKPPRPRAAETAFWTVTQNSLGAVFRVTPRSKNKTVTFLPVSLSAQRTPGPRLWVERVQRGAKASVG